MKIDSYTVAVSAMFEFSGENKFERERETIIFSIWQYLLNSVIIFQKLVIFLERCSFGIRKRIEVKLNFSLQQDQTCYVYVLCVLEMFSVLFCWSDLDARQTDIYFSKVCFLSFVYVSRVAYFCVGRVLRDSLIVWIRGFSR